MQNPVGITAAPGITLSFDVRISYSLYFGPNNFNAIHGTKI
jgi:hypothetical protein